MANDQDIAPEGFVAKADTSSAVLNGAAAASDIEITIDVLELVFASLVGVANLTHAMDAMERGNILNHVAVTSF